MRYVQLWRGAKDMLKGIGAGEWDGVDSDEEWR